VALLAGWSCGGDDLVLPEPPPSTLEITDGNRQEGPPGVPLPERLIVRLTDPDGGGIPDRIVVWAVSSGGGSISPTSDRTDAEGFASAAWTLGTAEGVQRASAQVPGIDTVAFTATNTGDGGGEPPPEVDRLVFRTPPRDADVGERFRVEVALVDADGRVVPLSGIFIYLGLFQEGEDTPTNDLLSGERFENTMDGIGTFDLGVERPGRYRLRALTDDLPELGPHGPRPYLFSEVFEVK
jgi:hypothetical protein